MSQLLTALNVVDSCPTQAVNHDVSLQNRLRAALEHARRVTSMYEEDHIEIALAWEMVAELEKAQRHQTQPRLSNFELYCLMNPDAPECRIYDL